NFPAVAIELPFRWPPAGRIHTRDNAMDAIGCKKAIVDTLAKTIGVDGIPKVAVRVAVIFAEGGRCHSKLKGGLEIFENLAPVRFVPSASTMTFVHYDQVEKVFGIFAVKTGATFVTRYGLISGEIHLPALHCLTLDLVAGVSKRSED